MGDRERGHRLEIDPAREAFLHDAGVEAREIQGGEAYGDDHLVDFHMVDLEARDAFDELWGRVAALKPREYVLDIWTRPSRKVDVERCSSLIRWKAGKRWYRHGKVNGSGKSENDCRETHG